MAEHFSIVFISSPIIVNPFQSTLLFLFFFLSIWEEPARAGQEEQDQEAKPRKTSRTLPQLKRLRDSHKTLSVQLPEYEQLCGTISLIENWKKELEEATVKPESPSLDMKDVLRIMWRTAVMAGRGNGFAPVLVPQDGVFVHQPDPPFSDSPCFCKLPEVSFWFNFPILYSFLFPLSPLFSSPLIVKE